MKSLNLSITDTSTFTIDMLYSYVDYQIDTLPLLYVNMEEEEEKSVDQQVQRNYQLVTTHPRQILSFGLNNTLSSLKLGKMILIFLEELDFDLDDVNDVNESKNFFFFFI